jgi:hypothetical protein
VAPLPSIRRALRDGVNLSIEFDEEKEVKTRGSMMKTAIQILGEVQEAAKSNPVVNDLKVPGAVITAAILELDEQLKELRNPQTRQETKEVSPGDISRGNLQRRLHTILTLAAGDGNEPEVATKIHAFFRTLEETQHAS